MTAAALLLAALMLPWLVRAAITQPRALTYLIFAAVPTQFIFVPVSDFFISPADILVMAGAGGLLIRLAAGRQAALAAVWQHRFLLLLVLAYVLGSLAHDQLSRTLARILLAFVPSMLACENLQEERHVRIAASALIVAALLDISYAAFWYLQGVALHPTRFAGIQGPNFSAMLIVMAAGILLARRAHAATMRPLVAPGALVAAGLSTLSYMGLAALAGSWSVLRRVITWRTTVHLAAAGAVVAAVLLSSDAVRDRLLARAQPEVQLDGVARTSADIRWLLHRLAWDTFLQNPVFGLGLGQFEPYSVVDPAIAASTGRLGHSTHNTYLEILVEGGLLAFACFGLHFLQYLRPLAADMRSMRRRRSLDSAAALVGLPIVLVCAALMNVLLFYLFWAVCGLALAHLTRTRRQARENAGRAAFAVT